MKMMVSSREWTCPTLGLELRIDFNKWDEGY